MIAIRGVMVRLTLLLCILLCMSSVVLAETDVVFDKVIGHDTSLSLNGTSYQVKIGTVNDSTIKVVSDLETVFLDEGDCIRRNYDKFCHIEYDDTQKIQANLTDARPIIEIDRDISSKSLDLGESTNITLTFTNVGGSSVTDFEFIENIPPKLTLISADGCSISKKDDQKITLDDDLPPDEDVVCEYTLQAGDEGLTTYEGKIYTSQLMSSQDADAVPQVAITSKNVFDLDINVSRESLAVGQPFVVTFTIENLESGSKGDNLTIESIYLELEDSFTIEKEYISPFLTYANSNIYKFSGLVEPEEILEQKIDLSSLRADENISLIVLVNYTLGSQDSVAFKRIVPLTQTILPLTCTYVVVDDAGNNLISLDKLNHTLPGFDQGELFVYVHNENSYVYFNNLVATDSGDIAFPHAIRLSSLRKNTDEILTSKLFSFDSLKDLQIKSSMSIEYDILDTSFESSCNGNIFVEKPLFLDTKKEIDFIEIVVDETYVKTIPRVSLTLINAFFLPIDNIEISENLPAQVFSNNNTKKSISLATLEEEVFSYEFIIPDDLVTLEGDEITLETDISYDIYDKSFTDTVSLTINMNDIISAQEGVVIDALIESKVQQLKDELNESLVDSQEVIVINESQEPVITYSPFLNYLTVALIVFLFFLAVIVLNIKYGLSHSIQSWLLKRKARLLAKKEERFAKNYKLYISKEEEYSQKLFEEKKQLKILQAQYMKKESAFKKVSRSLSLKIMSVFNLIKLDNKKASRLELQKKHLEKELALVHRSLTAHQQKKESLEVKRVQGKEDLLKRKETIIATQKSIDALQVKIKGLDSVLEKMKSDFESSYSKNESFTQQKIDEVKKDLSQLDKEYTSKRKVLKDEEKHLEHRE